MPTIAELLAAQSILGDQPVPTEDRKTLFFYQVWVEGGASSTKGAQLVGSAWALSFREACDAVCSDFPSYDPESRRLWGCRLFPTEQEARASFG